MNWKRTLSGLLVAAMMVSVVPASAVGTLSEEESVEIPEADILNVDFSNGNGDDNSTNNLEETEHGTVAYVKDETLGKTVANFDGDSAYSYPLAEQYTKMEDGFTFEVTFCYNEYPSDEQELLSNQSGGGFGLGARNGEGIFFCHVLGNDYATPTGGTIQVNKWHHAAGVFPV